MLVVDNTLISSKLVQNISYYFEEDFIEGKKFLKYHVLSTQVELSHMQFLKDKSFHEKLSNSASV